MRQHVLSYWTWWFIIAILSFLVMPASALTVGQMAPDFTAKDLSGRTVQLRHVWRNKIVILYFWDVRFQVCRQGLSELQKLHARYPEELTILAVNIDPEARSELNNFRRDHPWAERIGQLLLDTGEGVRHYDAELSVPVSCIIDKRGRVAFYEQSFDKKKIRRSISKLIGSRSRKGLWGQYLWEIDDLNNVEVFDWGRGDVFSLAYLREGRQHWTFGIQASFSYQNPTKYEDKHSILMSEVASGSATLSVGPPPFLWRRFGISLSAGAAGYERLDKDTEPEIKARPRTSPNPISLETDSSTHIIPVADLNMKVYIIDPILIYASGGIDLDSVYNALDNGQSILEQDHVYRYEAGIRAYITRDFNLNIGYGQWRLGDRNVEGVKIAAGYTF